MKCTVPCVLWLFEIVPYLNSFQNTIRPDLLREDSRVSLLCVWEPDSSMSHRAGISWTSRYRYVWHTFPPQVFLLGIEFAFRLVSKLGESVCPSVLFNLIDPTWKHTCGLRRSVLVPHCWTIFVFPQWIVPLLCYHKVIQVFIFIRK